MDAPVHPIVAFADGTSALLAVGPDNANVFSWTPPQQSPLGAPVTMNDSVGTGDLTAVHNTPLHVSGLVIVAILVVIGLRVTGFRFVVGANVASGLGG